MLAGYDNGDVKLFDLRMNQVSAPGLQFAAAPPPLMTKH